MRKIQWVFVLALPIMSFALSVLTWSLSASFSWGILITYAFWRRYAIVTICSTSTYISVQYARHETNIANGEYQEAEKALRSAVRQGATDLPAFLHTFNRERKKSYYAQKCCEKISKLSGKISKIKEKGAHDPESERRIAELENQIKEWKAKSDPEYLEREIDYIHVKLQPITTRQLSGVKGKKHSIPDIQELEDVDKFYLRKGATRIGTGFLITAFITMIAAEAMISADISVVIMIICNFTTICMAAFSGIRVSDYAFRNILLPNQMERISIMKQFNEKRKTTEKEVKTEKPLELQEEPKKIAESVDKYPIVVVQ